jgi:hypothetical protein
MSLIHDVPTSDIPPLLDTWEELTAACDSHDPIPIATALAAFSKGLRDADPASLVHFSGLPVLPLLLSLFDFPELAPFADNVARAVDDALNIPDANLDSLCGRSLLGRLFIHIAPKCRCPALVFRIAQRMALSSVPLGAEFIADGHAGALLSQFAAVDHLTQEAVCLFLQALLAACPPELHPACADVAAFVRAQMAGFPGAGRCCVDLFHAMLRINEDGDCFGLAGFDFAELYARLLFPLTSENRTALLDFVRSVFKDGIQAAIEAFEWRFIGDVAAPGLESELLPLCRLMPALIRGKTVIIVDAIEAGVIQALVAIGDRATFPVKKWVFKSLAIFVEVVPWIVVPIIIQTPFMEQVVDLIEGAGGKLLESVLRFLCRFVFAASYAQEPMGILFREWQILERVLDLDTPMSDLAQKYRVSILGVAPTVMPLFGEE